MKRLALTVTGALAASPAFAHTGTGLHWHGTELVILAIVVPAVAIAGLILRKR